VTLRARLVVVLAAVVAGALLATGIATYLSLRAFLLDRVDEQVAAARGPVARALLASSDPFGFPQSRGDSRAIPPGTFGQLRDASGATLSSVAFVYEQDADVPRPSMPDAYPIDEPFTTGAADGSARFRAIASHLPGGGQVLVAIPLSDVSSTLGRLLAILVAVGAAVLAGLALLARMLIDRELRPLHRIEETAGAIAAGDLSRRIEPTDPHTEVGRLGISLNEMLGQIERAFSDKEASEDRLRRFLADASHELRTPLTSIRGYAELFRRGADARPDDLAKAMARIEEEAGRMGVLVDDLLLLARLDQGRPLEREPVDLAAIAADAVADARAVDPDRPIELDATDAVAVLGDETRLRQVAANLVGNALAHTPRGTPVRVSATVREGYAVLEVADEGPGIDSHEVERVFDRFHRAGTARAEGTEGAGLGLSIAVAIARAHGGDIRLQSEAGNGATFRVLIPAAEQPVGRPA